MDNGAVIDGEPQRMATRQSDMAAFDRLPRVLRCALNDAPMKMSSENILSYVGRFPDDAIVYALQKQFDDFLAKPRELTGWPG